MDLSALKEALGDETFTELETYVQDLVGQRDQARTEGISGRRSLKERTAKLESEQTMLLERLGIESIDDIDNLPSAKGAAEATAQFETKVKRLERQLQEERESRETVEGRFRESQKAAHLSRALSSHEWLASDVVESFVTPRLQWDGEELLFKTDDGRLTTVKDGVAGLAKARPELLKPSGAGGAGVRSGQAGGTGGQQQMSRAEFEALPPAEQMEAAKSGVELH